MGGVKFSHTEERGFYPSGALMQARMVYIGIIPSFHMVPLGSLLWGIVWGWGGGGG